MADRTGYLSVTPEWGVFTTTSADLGEHTVDYWPPHHSVASAPFGVSARTASLPVASHAVARAGHLVHSYFADFYNRIHVNPARLDLGNITTAQSEDVEVWSAYLVPRTLQAIDVLDGDGITFTGPGSVPQTFAPLASKVWEVTVSNLGGSTLDARVVWSFDVGSGTLAVTANRIVPWVVPPNWSNGVRETLAWLTDVLQARTGKAQKRQLRSVPRRQFEFDVLAAGRERRVLDALLFDWSARVWALPIWHDVQSLTSAVPQGAASINCRTVGFEFVAGGAAMLWADVNRFEVVDIDAVGASSITLQRVTVGAWSKGTRLYPVRTARLDGWPRQSMLNDEVAGLSATFMLSEPCDWASQAPTTTYRGAPVLEWRPDESEDPATSHDREAFLLDADTGLVDARDFSGVAYTVRAHRWVLGTRADHTAMRGLLYWLRGRMAQLWLPSWSADISLLATVPAAGLTMTVDWCGYTRYGRGQTNRRDIRVQLRDGTVFYRRLVGWAEVDTDSEQLTMDSTFGRVVTPADVRLISFMALCEQARDSAELAHLTDADGVTRAAISFKAVKHDL